MGQPEIREKLRLLLSTPIKHECQVVYLMVEIRKLREHQSDKKDDMLKLFCDWVVHIDLDHKHRAAIFMFKVFDDAVERRQSDRGDSLAGLEVLSVSHFRDELRIFLSKNDQLPTNIVDDNDWWHEFLDLYSRVVSECPISYEDGKDPSKFIAKLSLTKDKEPDLDDSLVMSFFESRPFSVWMNWKVELKCGGEPLYWPFYNLR